MLLLYEDIVTMCFRRYMFKALSCMHSGLKIITIHIFSMWLFSPLGTYYESSVINKHYVIEKDEESISLKYIKCIKNILKVAKHSWLNNIFQNIHCQGAPAWLSVKPLRLRSWDLSVLRLSPAPGSLLRGESAFPSLPLPLPAAPPAHAGSVK